MPNTGWYSGPFRSARHQGRGPDRGFTLIEILVAFTILALFLGAAFEVFSSAVRAAQVGDEYARALVLARSKLDEFSVTGDLAAGAASGELRLRDTDTAMRWRIELDEYPTDEHGDPSALPVTPLSAVIEVSWEEGEHAHRVVLCTLLLAAKQ